MRKILFTVAAAGLVAGAFGATSASANECTQWPNPFGWDEIEVCHQLPVELEDIIEVE